MLLPGIEFSESHCSLRFFSVLIHALYYVTAGSNGISEPIGITARTTVGIVMDKKGSPVNFQCIYQGI